MQVSRRRYLVVDIVGGQVVNQRRLCKSNQHTVNRDSELSAWTYHRHTFDVHFCCVSLAVVGVFGGYLEPIIGFAVQFVNHLQVMIAPVDLAVIFHLPVNGAESQVEGFLHPIAFHSKPGYDNQAGSLGAIQAGNFSSAKPMRLERESLEMDVYFYELLLVLIADLDSGSRLRIGSRDLA